MNTEKIKQDWANFKALIDEVEPRMEKLIEKNNMTAGTDVRKFMQTFKQKAQEIRDDVQELRKEIDASRETKREQKRVSNGSTTKENA